MGDSHDWRPFIYGGFSSCTAEFGTFPIDTTKTRLQIQGQKLDGRFTVVRYNGMFHALSRITREEGVRALYSGIWPALLRQSTYGTIKFGIYYTLKKWIDHPEVEDMMTNIFCGVIAGVVSSAIANPTDVLKVRMQACSTSLQQKSMFECFGDVYRQEGISGLWRGVGPTAQRAAVITAVELPIYDICKHRLIQGNVMGDTVSNHFVSSFISSLGGAVASTPIDVVRVRLMNQRRLKSGVRFGFGMSSDFSLHKSRLYRGTLDCFVQTVRHEGIMALYRGFIPTWLRMGPWNVIFFITYEQLKKLY
ncbi:mitochondrial uncoupling protein Bmcp-like [Daphnia pulex]|uniref:Kidney mitochondrial carrier protein 1 n=1 Tax=Daphnia pulex TaxID=6669 RepID=E9GDL6_DAPPU|nr:mitochondrial uncoupling protein Bmcp-like [Daphnia pulex]XP_046448259.1 mitochondrial uncoupling protein Bmcp-like [Daphnia pulex]XP_046641132.1 mitochondrial uncoupling protein Bmcp-like [Daphnia pulicaria]EFX82458.1 hypothetical protein DAPPUDRAFT_316658 [Daphnia pulex]|eukprot:EFX82458.1 hypothetical protein DAPPUDRAFT_316658 [Daphnia pulex]